MNEIVPIRLREGENLVRFDRDILEKMDQAGILDDLGRFEMEDGVLVQMSPSRSQHGKAFSHLNALLVIAFGDRFTLASDTMLYLKKNDMRAPDIAVISNDTPDGSFEPKDILLCIEIADDSLLKDLKKKANEYSAYGISEYWVVDLPNRLLHIFREPEMEGYGLKLTQAWNEPVYPLCAPDIAIVPADQLDRVIR